MMFVSKFGSKLRKLFVLVGALSLAPLGLAQPLEQVKQDAAELVNSIGFYTNTQKDELLADVEEVTTQLDMRINSLQTAMEAEWESMSASARKEARETMDALRAQRVEVAEWYGGLKNSTYSAWDQTRQGFSEAYNVLYETWEKAEAEFAAES